MGYMRDLRVSKNLSQAEVAEAVQMARPTYSRLERGLTTATSAQAARLRQVFGVAVLGDQHLISERERRATADHAFYDLRRVSAEPWRQTEHIYGAQEGVPSEAWDWLQTFVHADSTLECRALAQFIRAGFAPKVDSPLLWGFEHLTLLDFLGNLLGARYLPCLLYKKDKCCICLWPQVTLRTENGSFRIDGLLFYKTDKTSGWIILEIDGEGHRSAGDIYRSSLLGLPELRLSSSDVRGQYCMQRLLDYVATRK